MKCQDVQKQIWELNMSERMIEHIENCAACRAEMKLVKDVGLQVEEMPIPPQTRSLMPDRSVIEEVVLARKRNRSRRWGVLGTVAAGVIVALWMTQPWGAAEGPTRQIDNLEGGPIVSKHLTFEIQVQQLLDHYGTEATFSGLSIPVRLPNSFTAESEVEEGLYWAYANEVSKAIGLDMTAHLGQSATATVWDVRDQMPFVETSNEHSRVVVIEQDNDVIGAWLLRKGDWQLASLSRRDWGDLVSSWSDWLLAQGFTDDSPDATANLFATPEDLIRAFYKQIDEGHPEKVYDLYSKAHQIDLFRGLDPDHLLTRDWMEVDTSLAGRLGGAEVVDIRPEEFLHQPSANHPTAFGADLHRNVFAERQYVVDLNIKSKPGRRLIYPDGPLQVHVIVVQETKGSPWRIEVANSAPQ